ncbi:MAG: NAD(P)H-binding protein [Rikenellaceae bacterium]|jgi:nucleoside-diphosphate-sugar epimerase|nr:NAD(P)H-binding protein [Rikenellaceae bacterium]
MKIAITGAAGNLGGLLARRLAAEGLAELNLLVHRRDVAPELRDRQRVEVFRVDLARPETLNEALQGVNAVIHFAGVLFRARPERFLPTTNTLYFRNLLAAAEQAGVRRVVLASFPHVEGESSPAAPAKGILTGSPVSVHARTRLDEERLLFDRSACTGMEAVSLRLGMVYGDGILMIDAMRWLARRRLLGVWRQPTWIHLISTEDCLAATVAALLNPEVRGIYHLGDEGVQTLQQFIDGCCAVWGCPKPWRMPVWMIRAAAWACETFSAVTGSRAPLTQDFITIGMSSYYGDTARTRAELLPRLKYRTYREGQQTLRR